jgi:hypothetical protein
VTSRSRSSRSDTRRKHNRRDRTARVHELGRPEVTEIEIRGTTHRVAEVQPMDLDGVRTLTVGTVLWGFGAVALLPFLGTLEEQGRGWWFWTAIAGLGLGLLGIEYCLVRRNALQAQARRQSSDGSGVSA